MASAVILDVQKQGRHVISGLVKFSSSQKGMLGGARGGRTSVGGNRVGRGGLMTEWRRNVFK